MHQGATLHKRGPRAVSNPTRPESRLPWCPGESSARMTRVIRGPVPGTEAGSVSTAPAHPSDPGPFARFRADHQAVLVRLEAMEARLAPGALAERANDEELRDLVRLLERQFATHMAAEDALLFPAVAEAFPAAGGTLAQLQADHVELRLMLATLARWAWRGDAGVPVEQVLVALRDFVDLLRLHIHREEIAVFDVATRALSPAEIEGLASKLDVFLGPDDPLAPSRENPKGNPS